MIYNIVNPISEVINVTDEKSFQRAKDLLDNFNRIDENVQDKLLNGVKCMATVFDLANVAVDTYPAPQPNNTSAG